MQAARGLTLLSSKNPTFSVSKKVFCKISNAIRGSNIQWRGRSFAASVPSESSKSESGRKRISKDERRAMVESFVDKYKALNAGKYPTASATKKQVGGSYYVVKKILQELEYQSKISPISRASQNSLEKEVPKKEFQPSTKVEEVSSFETTMDLKCYEPSLSVKDESSTIIISNDLEAKEEPQVSSHVEKPVFEEPVNPTTRGDDSDLPQTYSHQIGQESNELLRERIEKPQDSSEEAATSEGSLDLDGPKEEVMQEAGQEALESDKLARDIPGEESKEDPVPKTSTFWGNLKSFADGVIKLWRNN